MAELADALDLGSSERSWGFKSLIAHYTGRDSMSRFFDEHKYIYKTEVIEVLVFNRWEVVWMSLVTKQEFVWMPLVAKLEFIWMSPAAKYEFCEVIYSSINWNIPGRFSIVYIRLCVILKQFACR